MDVTKCEAFLAAIDHGSLTAAGVFLGYTQSGITRMINALAFAMDCQPCTG